MHDPFFDHWPTVEASMGSAVRVETTILPPPVVVVGTVGFPPPQAEVFSRAMPAVRGHRILKLSLSCRMSSITFLTRDRLAEPEAPAERSRPQRRPRPSRQVELPRIAPPPGLPLRERLHQALQPPIGALLSDRRLWVPLEPFAYQLEGINFLAGRWSALLADEMGLGKTMQAIMAIRLLLRAGLIRSALVVCPKPLLTNWLREFQMWAEEIPVQVVEGGSWGRRHAWLHDHSPVKLANYEGLTRDEELIQQGLVSFDLVVLDEAQRIKNRDSKTAACVHSLRRSRSWALTGTPVENRAIELVSLLDFVENRRSAPPDFGNPSLGAEPDDTPRHLRDQVAKVLLRRTKEQVLADMPPKLVRDVYLDLGPQQRKTYETAEREGVIRLSRHGRAIPIEHVFDLVRRLKQICNFDPVTGESVKAEQLRADLEEIAASGHKAILFSQWITTLETLAHELRDFRPLLYHGRVSPKERDEVLARFATDPDRPVLFLTYAVGATGLNIQCSNYVFLFDHWWNPAIEEQAINRAHRIGQTQPVFVSRFVAPGTIEERIQAILDRKRELFRFLIDDQPPPGSITREDLMGLFDLRVRDPSEDASSAA